MSDDLINSAVTFLQDPKVADAPLAKRIAFLESKGLTSEQVNIALQRAQQPSPPAQVNTSSPTPSSSYAQSLPPVPYASYQTQAPPALPNRDWRDWFIMAVVSGGFSWAAYIVAKRYILPLIQPPTQSQLEADKETIKAQFDQVQEMLSILQSDAAAAKDVASEQAKKVDAALEEIDKAVGDMKDKTARRETDIRRLGLELDQIRELIPKAIDSVKQAQTDSLNDLNTELRSLKTLLQNRIKATTTPSFATKPSTTASGATENAASGSTTNNDAIARFASKGTATNGIPAWQLAASNETQEASTAENKTS